MTSLGVRWTIGDVSDEGFQALQLSIWGAWKLFGAGAEYAVCVNSRPLADARAATGALPTDVAWRAVDRSHVPAWISERLDEGMAEGVGWKFAPLRLHPARWSLALDNDCVLWDVPHALAQWLDGGRDACLLAEDVRACFGRFTALCGEEARNSGIRGLPPTFDLEAALRAVLDANPVPLTSEVDEQGLQVAALQRAARTLVVTLDDVTICSPTPPHVRTLGRCGAHFVGLNARALPWTCDGRPASDVVRENFRQHEATLRTRVGLT